MSIVSMSASAYSWNDPDIMTVDEAVAEYESDTGSEVETFRYYFLMPNGYNGERGDDGDYGETWYTKLVDGTPATNTAGIYWWGSDVADPDGWIGYLPSGVDENDPDVYYADVPQAVTTIIWNNGIDGGMDIEDPIYYCSAQTVNIPCEYYDSGESPNYPDGTENFDEMIFVITPDLIYTGDWSLKQTCDGEWYYYYGNGCYGFTENGDEDDCLRDDHYDASGNHLGKHEAPTVAPTKAPTVAPTSAPTQNPIVDSQYVIAGADEKDPSKINGQVHGYMGDADGDGEASVMDATEIQLQVARLKTMDELHMLLSDVDRDGDVSVMDATEIQLFVARLKGSDVIGRILYTPITEFDPDKYTYIKADGEYYMVLSDTKTFTYTHYLACDRKIAAIDVTTYYDNDGLQFVPDVDEYGDYIGSELPNLPAPVYNYGINGEIIYNYSVLSGVRFPIQDDIETDKNILFTGKFEITGGPGVYDLDTRIRVIGDTNNNKIIYNYEIVDEDAILVTDSEIDGLYHIDKSLVPTEPPTDPPTERPTERPTVAPTDPPSVEPTMAPTEVPTIHPEDFTDVYGDTLYDGYAAYVNISSRTRKVMSFTPSVSGYYTIVSDCLSSYDDPVCELYDNDYDFIDSSDDYIGRDFCLTSYLTAGKTYYYKVYNYYGSYMSCPIKFYSGSYVEEPSYTETGVIHFDANSAGWNNFKKVFCHIWVYNGDSFYAWQAKAEGCTDADKDGIWTYDLEAKNIELESGQLYAVIFSNENGMQTYNLLMGTDCLGDTAYCDGTMYENPEDSSKTAQAAFWKGQDPTVYGPEKCVTSIGNVVGTCVPIYTSSQAMFEDFLINKLENARTYSGKDDQTLLDDTARALGLKKDNVQQAIENTYVYVDWSPYKSTLNGDIIDGPGPNQPSIPGRPSTPDQPNIPGPPDLPNYRMEYGNTLRFDTNSAGWNNFKKVYCHIWVYGGDSFYSWQAKGSACTDADGDGIWTYDLDAKGVTLEPGTLYAVIFSNENGMQTYNLLFDYSVLGDVACCAGISYEAPEDSSKTVQAAYWCNQDYTEFGPELCITSIGNVIGTCVPRGTSTYDLFVDFLDYYLENARRYSGKNDQNLIDDTAETLGLSQEDVRYAIYETRVYVNWSESKSKLPVEVPEVDDPPYGSDGITRTEAFDEIKEYLQDYGDYDNTVYYDDDDSGYSVEVRYNSYYNAIEIYGYDYSSPREVDTYIRINRGEYVFYYETEMLNPISSAVYFAATGYGSMADSNPNYFYTNKATFSSSNYSYSQAEPTITTGFAKAFATTDYALWGETVASIYDLL